MMILNFKKVNNYHQKKEFYILAIVLYYLINYGIN